MAWCKLEDTFCEDPKWDLLADELDVSRSQAAGLVAFLWSWCVTHAPDGHIPRSERTIARATQWEGDHSALLRALLKARVIDTVKEGYEVHGFAQRAESFLRALRVQKHRSNAHKTPETVTRNDAVTTHSVSDHEAPKHKLSLERRGEEKREDPDLSASDFSPAISTEIDPRSSLSSDAKKRVGLTPSPSAPVVPEKKRAERSAEQKARGIANNRLYRDLYTAAEGHPPTGIDQAFNGMMAKFSDKHADGAAQILRWVFERCPDKSFRAKGWPLELIVQQAPRLWRELNNPRTAVENLAAPRQQHQLALAASNDLAFEEYHRRKAERLANADQV